MLKSGDNIKKYAHDLGQMRQLSLKISIMSLSPIRDLVTPALQLTGLNTGINSFGICLKLHLIKKVGVLFSVSLSLHRTDVWVVKKGLID